jgi:hypothetical protein
MGGIHRNLHLILIIGLTISSWPNLTGCTRSNYTHKENSAISRPARWEYGIDNVNFQITEASFQDTERGVFFVTRWGVRNTDNKKRKIRLSELSNQSYVVYGRAADKLALHGIGIGTCEGEGPCFSYINLLPGQVLTFILKTPPYRLHTDEIIKDHVRADIRARFEIKEKGYYTYPVDIEFEDVVFRKEKWETRYDTRPDSH